MPHNQPPESQPKKRSGCWYAFLGAGAGGCLLPAVLFFIAAVALGDTGGPLFWPLISVPLALIGLALGFWYHAEFKSRDDA